MAQNLNTYERIYSIMDTIEENVNVCCAITMDPIEVEVLLSELRLLIGKLDDRTDI